MKNKNILKIAIVTACFLLIPLIAMQFSDEVLWTFSDFIFAGVLIFGTGLTYELIAKRSGTLAYRFAVGLALLAMFLLVWINAAVGIIGSEDNPANAMYFGVILVVFLGTIMARFKAYAMMRVMILASVVQALVPVVAFLVWKPDFNPGVMQVFILNTAFVALFVGSALLFRQASESQQ